MAFSVIELYLHDVTFKVIRDYSSEGDAIEGWYREYDRETIEDGRIKYEQSNWFLTNDSLIHIIIAPDQFEVKSYMRKQIVKTEKNFKYQKGRVETINLTIHLVDGTNLELVRPNRREDGNPEDYEIFVSLIR